MAVKCPNCGSADTVAQVNSQQCHRCGALFDFQGNKVEPGPDQSTRDAIMNRLAPSATTVGGNYADLQRAGADAATGKGSGGLGDAVVVPPNAGPGELVTPAEHEASRGEWTRETERTGLVDEPQPPEPGEEQGGRSYDPGSQSPQPVEAATPKATSKSKAADKTE